MRNYYLVRNGFMAVMNILYPVIILSLLLYSYVYEALACHGKLSIPTKLNASSSSDYVMVLAEGSGFSSTKTPRSSFAFDLGNYDA